MPHHRGMNTNRPSTIEQEIRQVPLAGFSANCTPDGTFLSAWGNDFEVKVSLSREQAKTFAQTIQTHGVFAGFEKIKIFKIPSAQL